MPKLKSKLWLQAQIRLCDQQFIEAVISHKGDEDAGAILLKVVRAEGTAVYSQAYTMEGEPAWMQVVGAKAPQPEFEADDYINRQVSRDRDLWVLEVVDPKGLYTLDRPVL